MDRQLSPVDLVFAKVTGEPLDPSAVSHEFRAIADSVNMPDVHVHTLRHMFGTYMLNSGANIKIVSKALGHASTAFTADTYLHPDIEEMKKAARALDAALAAGVPSVTSV